MASSTLSLCSSLALQCKISPKPRIQANCGSSNNNNSLPFLSLPSSNNKLSVSSSSSSKRLNPTKASELEAPVLDAPPRAEDATIVVADSEEPPAKREEIFAVVMIGGRQYIVFPGRFLYTQRLKGANVNDKIVLKKVLLVGTKTVTYVGKPVVTDAAVHAVVEEQGLDSKVIVYKYKRKKNYRRNIGHRQPNTRIRITGITGYENYPATTLDSPSQPQSE